MIKNLYFFVLLLFAIHFSYSSPMSITSSSENSDSISQYEKFEFTFTIDHEFNNPFDPEEVDIQVIFHTPNDKKINIPAFYYQGFTRELRNSSEYFELSAFPVWKVRFTPIITGKYEFDVYLNNIKLNESSFKFSCLKGEEKGFVRIDHINNVFCLDNGKRFYPIGHNIRSLKSDKLIGDIILNEGSLLIENVIQKMSFNGENFLLLDIISSSFGLELSGFSDKDAGWAVKMDLKNAWVLDKIIDTIFQRDMFISFFFASHGQYSICAEAWPEGQWDKNPYNIKNCGFLEKPNDFFISPDAKKSFKKYLRYVVARYGYSPRIFSWLMFSDMDFTQPYRDKMGCGWVDPLFHLPELTEWQKEMAEYVRSIDSYNHLISTSFAYLMHGEDIWKIPETDFLLHTTYGSVYGYNMIDIVKKYDEIYSEYDKPYLIAINGAHTESNSEKLEAQLHTGIWAQYMNPKGPGCIGFNAWSLVDSKDLYYHFKALAEYNLGEEEKNLNEFEPVFPSLNTSDKIRVLGRMNKDRHYLWVFDNDIKENVKHLDSYKTIDMTYKPVKAGKFIVEFWNTFTGKIVSKANISTKKYGTLTIRLPGFKGDLACKVIRM